jgi:hypothetical protein
VKIQRRFVWASFLFLFFQNGIFQLEWQTKNAHNNGGKKGKKKD